MSRAPWVEFVTEDALLEVVRSHAALRRQVRDRYLHEAAACLGGTPWTAARALAAALHRYETSPRYRRARRLGREDGPELDRALYAALAWGPVPQTPRRLYSALTRARLARSLAAAADLPKPEDTA